MKISTFIFKTILNSCGCKFILNLLYKITDTKMPTNFSAVLALWGLVLFTGFIIELAYTQELLSK